MRRLVLATFVLLETAVLHADFPEPAKLPSRPELPDPLGTRNGERVTSKEQWEKQCRPELKALFQHYMYGHLPPAPEKVEFKVEREDPRAFGGKATLKEVTLRLGSPEAPAIHLL